jgi:hypothetical protein
MEALWRVAPRTQEHLLDLVEEVSVGAGGTEGEEGGVGGEGGKAGKENQRTGLDVLSALQVLQRKIAPLQAVVSVTLRAEV